MNIVFADILIISVFPLWIGLSVYFFFDTIRKKKKLSTQYGVTFPFRCMHCGTVKAYTYEEYLKIIRKPRTMIRREGRLSMMPVWGYMAIVTRNQYRFHCGTCNEKQWQRVELNSFNPGAEYIKRSRRLVVLLITKLIIAGILATCCVTILDRTKKQQAVNVTQSPAITDTDYTDEEDAYEQVADRNQLQRVMNDWQNIGKMEFTTLYYPDTTRHIADDATEVLILVKILITQGFEVTDWGRGNWQHGPRIVSYTLSKGNYDFQIDKLYYSTDKEEVYRVTERIKRLQSR